MTDEGYARVIADSTSTAGVRLTTMEVRLHRFVLAELNTWRTSVRSSPSSRAIPVERTVDRFENDPAWPASWPGEVKGMQGGAELEGDPLQDAKDLLQRIHDYTADEIVDYLAEHPDRRTRLHKSLLNRPMEWGQWHTVTVTATAWDNFLAQRCHPDAQPEIRVAAEMMRKAREASEPALLMPGEWHLPYVDDEDRAMIEKAQVDIPGVNLRDISVARCARSSYFMPITPDADLNRRKATLQEDYSLYNRLVTQRPMHAAPMEHVARPEPMNSHQVLIEPEDAPPFSVTLPLYGPLLGWHARRFDLEGAMRYQSYS